MTRHHFLPRVLLGTLAASFLTAQACDSDSGGGGLPAIEGCDHVVGPTDDDADSLQTLFIEASSGDTICLVAGTYSLTRELNIASHRDLTVRGAGETREDVVLDFGAQTSGSDAVTVTADGFTIENLSIKNSPGDGIVVKADDSHFRNIKVSWDAGSVTENGAYAVYPNNCNRTIIEDIEVTGASDAGIYVGSCQYAIVRNNKVYANVAGIEIENTLFADVYGNEVTDNVAGILTLLLPGLEIKEVSNVLIRNNIIKDNNRQGFAAPGSIVASVPPGTGVLALAGNNIEFRDNVITGHDSTGILIVSYKIMAILLGDNAKEDPDTDPYSRDILVTGNSFADNGGGPRGALALLGVATLEDVVWDGWLDEQGNDAGLCLGETDLPSFRNFGGGDGIGDPSLHSTDASPHACTRTALPEMMDFSNIGE